MKTLMKTFTVFFALLGILVLVGCKNPIFQQEFPNQQENPGNQEDSGNQENPSKQEITGLKILPEGTDGTFGTKGKYVEFGKWPQSKIDNSVTVGDTVVKINGWDCYLGDDGSYYVKEEGNPYQESYSFENGGNIKKGDTYYFKLEPIKWRVITDDYNQNKKLLLVENILVSHSYDATSNKYDESDIRKYLNNDFINKAFTPEERECIPKANIDNSIKSVQDDKREPTDENSNVCGNTSDKVFLLSLNEITNPLYGFDSFDVTTSANKKSVRLRKTTDYARATGAYTEINSGTGHNCGAYWLRSPHWDNDPLVYGVTSEGDIKTRFKEGTEVSTAQKGVVPALALNF